MLEVQSPEKSVKEVAYIYCSNFNLRNLLFLLPKEVLKFKIIIGHPSAEADEKVLLPV